MDEKIRVNLDGIWSEDRERQNQAFTNLLEASEQPVDWAYEAWDELLTGLRDPDNHVRAITAQILCNLAARSDLERRMLRDFDALLAVTKDERFVTARHCLQALWRIGLAGKEQQRIVVEGLSRRFAECGVEKNGTLIRYDIIQDLRNLFDAVQDETVREQAFALIETEADLKYRKKYASVWKRK